MADSYLIDVNVCLDVMLKRSPYWDNSARIFQSIEKGLVRGMVSAISFDTMFYILSSDIGAVKAQSALEKFRQNIDVAAVDRKVVDHALQAEWRDLEDALQYYSGHFSRCKGLITRNKKDYPKKTSMSVLTPVEFLSTCL